MGKPLGLGKIKIDILNLLFVNRKDRYETDPLFDTSFFHQQTDTNVKRIEEISKKLTESHADFHKRRYCSTVTVKEKNQNCKTISGFIEVFKTTIKNLYGDNWLTQLENIGNPESTKTKGVPVQYPNLENGGVEECFKWWVWNSGKEKDVTGEKKTLKAVPEKVGGKMPTLPITPGQYKNT